MPQIKGPDGVLINFPDTMSPDEIKGALRKRYGGPETAPAPAAGVGRASPPAAGAAVAAPPPAPAAPTRLEATIKPYVPTLREKFSGAAGDVLARAGMEPHRATEYGKRAGEAIGLVPGPQQMFGGQEAYRHAKEGAYGKAALDVLGMVPAVGSGRGAAKAAAQTAARPPVTPGALAEDAQGLIRQRIGLAERDSARAAAALQPYERAMNLAPPQQLQGFMDYVEGRSTLGGARLGDPQMQSAADEVRSQMQARRTKLESLGKTAEMNFIEDYFPHMWKDPRRAQQFVSDWVAPKQGSGAALKKRELPTIADGLRAGLELKHPSPVEAVTAYTNNMDRYIAMEEVLEAARAQNVVRRFQPGKQPADYEPLKGRAGQSTVGGQLYAPAAWARDYNNFISRGFAELDPRLGSVVEQARAASNFVTMAELSFSAFHAITMANEAIASEAARAAGLVLSKEPMKAAKALLNAPLAPVSLARTGRKLQDVYLGLSPGTAQNRQIVDLLTEANMRMVGIDKTLRQSAGGSFFTSWRKAALSHEFKAATKAIGEAQGPFNKGMAVAKTALEGMARVAETVQQPLFQKYIPMVKNGAAMETLKSWLELHPTATHEEQLSAARKIVDSIDNRFGEMVQDNIFWNQALKQLGQVFMRSYSWNLGSIREIGGGAAKMMAKPESMSMKSAAWDPKANYIFGLVLSAGVSSVVYQFLKTGEAPKDAQDLIAPRTGGVDAKTGMPERVVVPGYMKDVYGWAENPVQEAKNKIATLPRAMGELAANQDWRGDPIRGPDRDQWLSNLWDYTMKNFGPFTFRELEKGRKEGSALTKSEVLMGLRPAGMKFTDPETLDAIMARKAQRAWKGKTRREEREKAQYGGPQ